MTIYVNHVTHPAEDEDLEWELERKTVSFNAIGWKARRTAPWTILRQAMDDTIQ